MDIEIKKESEKCNLHFVVNWFLWIIGISIIWVVAILTKHHLGEYADSYLLFIGWATCCLWHDKEKRK